MINTEAMLDSVEQLHALMEEVKRDADITGGKRGAELRAKAEKLQCDCEEMTSLLERVNR